MRQSSGRPSAVGGRYQLVKIVFQPRGHLYRCNNHSDLRVAIGCAGPLYEDELDATSVIMKPLLPEDILLWDVADRSHSTRQTHRRPEARSVRFARGLLFTSPVMPVIHRPPVASHVLDNMNVSSVCARMLSSR